MNRDHSTFPGEHIRILTRPGGAASYGMNNMVTQLPRAGQLLLIEYDKYVVDVDGEGYEDDFDEWFAPRHLGHANAVFVNGSVQPLTRERADPALEMWQPASP